MATAAHARRAARTAAALRDAGVYVGDVQRVVTTYGALVEVRTVTAVEAREGCGHDMPHTNPHSACWRLRRGM
jgi:hypothetical protein